MSEKPNKTAGYGDARAKPAAEPRNVPGRFGNTRRGVGVDPVRPPARIEPGSRKLTRPVGVALVLPDHLERATLAKSLVQARCSVTSLTTASEVRPEELGELEIVVADFDAPNVLTIVDALRSIHPDLPAIAWTNRVAVVETGLKTMSFGRFEVVDRSSRAPRIVEAVRRLVGA